MYTGFAVFGSARLGAEKGDPGRPWTGRGSLLNDVGRGLDVKQLGLLVRAESDYQANTDTEIVLAGVHTVIEVGEVVVGLNRAQHDVLG